MLVLATAAISTSQHDQLPRQARANNHEPVKLRRRRAVEEGRTIR
jgi:hypothetical protein